MKCSYCDAELNDSAKFCHKCGKAAKENKKNIMKVKFEKKWIYIAAGVILCACLFVFMNSLYKNAYCAQKYLSGIVDYINANAYREALEYYDLNPYVEKVDKSQMDNDELQLIALYYYADYLNFVTNISEEEMVSLEQYETKYNNVIDMEVYLCSSAVKNIDMIHAEVTSCQYAPEKLDECLSGVFDGADLMQNTREAFLNKRKSMEERCEGYSVSELNDLYETEHKKWEEHVTEQQKLFDELYKKMGVDLLTDISYWSTDDQISLPINTREIDSFYKYSDEFFLGVRKWIAALEVSLSKLFNAYVEEHQYTFANSKQVTEPLPEYIVCDDGTNIIVYSHENFISGSIEYFESFKKRYEAQESENLRRFIKDTILLWARKSKENLQDDILPNLEQICLLEDGSEVMAQNNMKTNEGDTVSTNAVEETTQERIVVNPGDTVTGTIERRFSQSDDLIGGIDSEYYVLCFSKPVDLVVWDIEQQSEIIVEECNEIAVHAPQMGNMGNLDLEPYIGRQVSCWINASTTATRIGIMAEVGNLIYSDDNAIVQEETKEVDLAASEESYVDGWNGTGNKTKQRYNYANGSIAREEEYDEAGNMTKRTQYNEDGSVAYWNEYEYDEAGNMKTIYSYLGGCLRSENKFDEAGNRTEIIEYYADGSISDWTEYEYDEKGEIIIARSVKDKYDSNENRDYFKKFAEYAYMTGLSPFENISDLSEEDALKMFIILNAVGEGTNEQVYYDEQTGMCQIAADVVERVIREKTDFMGDNSWGRTNWKTMYSQYNRVIYEHETETFYYLPGGEYFPWIEDDIDKIEVMKMSSGYICVDIWWDSGFYQQFLYLEKDPRKISSYSKGKM